MVDLILKTICVLLLGGFAGICFTMIYIVWNTSIIIMRDVAMQMGCTIFFSIGIGACTGMIFLICAK